MRLAGRERIARDRVEERPVVEPRLVAEAEPRLVAHGSFVDLGPGDELERRKSERRLEEKLSRSEFNR